MANNVGFKRGLHAALPLTGATEGVFYLTTDTERFYVGKSDGTLAELNKSVRTIASTRNLPDLKGTTPVPDVAIGDFYYAVEENILAVCIEDTSRPSGKAWRQVNPDTNTQIHSAAFSIATSNDIATITQTIKLADKDGDIIPGGDKTSSFTIAGSNGVKVASSGAQVTLSGDYGLSVTAGTNAADINLLASGTEQDDFTIAGGDNVTVTTDATNKKVTIAAKDTIVASAKAILTSEGKIDIELKDQRGNIVTHVASDAITYLVDGISYTPGSTLPVYTKAQIDTKLNTLNGLTYKGTVGPGGSVGDNLPTTNVSVGDMYLVVGDKNIIVTGSGNSGKRGDLFIATGTEGTDGIISGTITWTYVPSGDDEHLDTTYKAVVDTTNHTVILKDNQGNDEGGIDLDAGAAISLSSTSSASNNGSILKTTIKHADVERADSNESSPTSSNTTKIVTGVTTNAQGHVTAVQTATVDGSTLRGYTLAGTDTVTAGAVTTVHELKTGDGTKKGTITDVVSSTSLKFAAVTNGYSIDLEWGTF